MLFINASVCAMENAPSLLSIAFNSFSASSRNVVAGNFRSSSPVGVSIETIGGDPDGEGIWHNHRLCGLSVVAHPNNLNAYAVISNSIDEAKKYGLKTDKLEKLVNNDIKQIVQRTSNRLNKIKNSI